MRSRCRWWWSWRCSRAPIAHLGHSSWVARAAQEATQTSICPWLLVTFTCFTVLRGFVGASWLLTITKSLDPDISTFTPCGTPAVSNQPIIFAIGSISYELNCVVHVTVAGTENASSVHL